MLHLKAQVVRLQVHVSPASSVHVHNALSTSDMLSGMHANYDGPVSQHDMSAVEPVACCMSVPACLHDGQGHVTLEVRQGQHMRVCLECAHHWATVHSNVITVAQPMIPLQTYLYNASKCVDDGMQEEVGVLCACRVEDSLNISTLQKPAPPQS